MIFDKMSPRTDHNYLQQNHRAWRSPNKMKNIWKSDSAEKIKLKLFTGTMEITFLYMSITWSLTKAEEKGLNGTSTRML